MPNLTREGKHDHPPSQFKKLQCLDSATVAKLQREPQNYEREEVLSWIFDVDQGITEENEFQVSHHFHEALL